MEQIEASTTELRQADATAATDATKGYALSPRFDADGALLGWVAAMSRRGRHILRVFLVTRHGGAEAARAAALAFRDATMQAFAPISKREFGTIVRSNNTSGIPGVARRVQQHHVYWTAIVYLPGGRTRKRSFSVKKYGEEQAHAMAIQARRQLLQEVEGWLTQHPDAVAQGRALPALDGSTLAPARERFPAVGVRVSPERRVYRQPLQWTTREGAVHVSASWFAEYSLPGGRVVRRSFSVARYGEEQARQLAQAQRRQWVIEPPQDVRRTSA